MEFKEEHRGTGHEATSCSCDQLLEKIWRTPTWKSYLVVMVLMATWLSTPSIVYVTAFAGRLPWFYWVSKLAFSNFMLIKILKEFKILKFACLFINSAI